MIKEDLSFYVRLLVEWNIANLYGPEKTFREGIEFRVSEFKMRNFIRSLADPQVLLFRMLTIIKLSPVATQSQDSSLKKQINSWIIFLYDFYFGLIQEVNVLFVNGLSYKRSFLISSSWAGLSDKRSFLIASSWAPFQTSISCFLKNDCPFLWGIQSFICTIEKILYIQIPIMGICWFYSTQSQDLIGPWFCFGESSFPCPSVPVCKVKLTSFLALGMYLWPNPNSDSTFYASEFCLATIWFKNRNWIQVCKIRICEIQFWGFSLIFLRQGKETSLCY